MIKKNNVLDLALNYGNEYKELFKNRRQTGKSLGQAFHLISLAMKDPGKEIEILDYEPFHKLPKRTQQVIQMSLINEIIKDLKLENFVINKSKATLKYDLEWFFKVGKQLESFKKQK